MKDIILRQTIIVKALKLLQQFPEEEIKKYIGEDGYEKLNDITKKEMLKLLMLEEKGKEYEIRKN